MSIQKPIQKLTHFIESSSENKTQSNFPPPLFDIPIHQTDETLGLTEHGRGVLTLEEENQKKKDAFNETPTGSFKRKDFSLHEECVPPNSMECVMNDKKEKQVDSFKFPADDMHPLQEDKNEDQKFYDNSTENVCKTVGRNHDTENNELIKSLTLSSVTLNTSINSLIGVINDLGVKLDDLQSRIQSLEKSQQFCKSYSSVDRPETINVNGLYKKEGSFEKITSHSKNGMNNTKLHSSSNISPASETVNTMYKKPTTNPFSSSDQLYSVSAQEETGHHRLEEFRRIEAEREFLLEQQRKRLLLDKKAKELMETISLTNDKSPTSLFDDTVERCELTKDCKRYTTGFNPLFE